MLVACLDERLVLKLVGGWVVEKVAWLALSMVECSVVMLVENLVVHWVLGWAKLKVMLMV